MNETCNALEPRNRGEAWTVLVVVVVYEQHAEQHAGGSGSQLAACGCRPPCASCCTGPNMKGSRGCCWGHQGRILGAPGSAYRKAVLASHDFGAATDAAARPDTRPARQASRGTGERRGPCSLFFTSSMRSHFEPTCCERVQGHAATLGAPALGHAFMEGEEFTFEWAQPSWTVEQQQLAMWDALEAAVGCGTGAC